MPQTSPLAILRALSSARIDFVVVGGVASVLNGAPVSTYDVDVVYAQDQANIERLLSVLEQLDAVFRAQPARRLRPNASHLAGTGHLNLLTSLGPLDVLAFIGDNLRYSDLVDRAREMEIAQDVHVRVLDLATIIAVKEQLGTDKDRATLPILRRTLQELKPPQ